MGNRRKIKNNLLRLKKKHTKVEQQSPLDTTKGNSELFSVLDSPLARAMQAEHPDSILTEEALVKLGVTKPYATEDVQLIRVVPAKANGVVVGQALIYDDGSIGYREDPNSDPEALKLVHETEKDFGYSLQEGRPFAVGEAGGPDGPPKEN